MAREPPAAFFLMGFLMAFFTTFFGFFTTFLSGFLTAFLTAFFGFFTGARAPIVTSATRASGMAAAVLDAATDTARAGVGTTKALHAAARRATRRSFMILHCVGQ